MFNITLTTPISLFVSLAALTGVTVHDTKIDKLTSTLVSSASITSSVQEAGARAMTSDPHTHVERVSLKDIHTAQPRLMPRHDQKKHLIQKNMPKGAHQFDGYCLPLA